MLNETMLYEHFRNPLELQQVLFKSLSHHVPYLHHHRSNLLFLEVILKHSGISFFNLCWHWAAPGRLASCALSRSIKACQRMSHCQASKRQKDWLQESWEIDLMMTHNIPPFLHSQTCQLIHNSFYLASPPCQGDPSKKVHQLKFPLKRGRCVREHPSLSSVIPGKPIVLPCSLLQSP